MQLSEIKLNTPYWIAGAIMYVIATGTDVVDHVVALDHGTDPDNIPNYAVRQSWYPVRVVKREATQEDVAAQRKEWREMYPLATDGCALNKCLSLIHI